MTSRIFKYRFLFLAVSGLLTTLPLLFSPLSYISWVSIMPFFAFIIYRRESGAAELYLGGLVFFMAYYLSVYHWFWFLYPLDFTGMSRLFALCVVLVAWIGLPLIQASIFALLPLIFSFFMRFGIAKKHRSLQILSIASLWILFEWGQGLTWAGVPWGRLSVGQYSNLAVIQSVALLGSYFVSFLIVCVNFLLAYAFLKENKKITPLIFALLIFAGNFAYGQAVLNKKTEETGTPYRVAAIQGNIPSQEKWTAKSREDTLNVYTKLTELASRDGAALILWPETALPFELLCAESALARVKELAKESEATLIIGTFASDGTASSNVLLAIDKKGDVLPDIYKKRYLVPFGEYLPMPAFVNTIIPPLASMQMYSDNLLAGEGSMLIGLPGVKIGGLICFDSIYERPARESVLDGAQIIFLATNDSWFYDSPAIYQHNGHAVMRALESGRYVVRAANTGISSIISPNGRIIKKISPLVEGYITDDVYLRDELTFYMKTGNVLVLISAVFSGVLLIESAAGKFMHIKRKKAVSR